MVSTSANALLAMFVKTRRAVLISIGSIAALVGVALALPPIPQNPEYHNFADRAVLFGVPHFWNVISNLAFLAVAIWGIATLPPPTAFLQPWERTAHLILLGGLALVAFGSGYYHLHPNDATLFWDRLPMTVVFMSLLSITVGERISMTAGRLMLPILLALGIASVIVWNLSGDLRYYLAVQFGTLLLLPLIILTFRPTYSGTSGIWWMIALYGVSKVLELFDHRIAFILPAGGHPLKHLAAALAMLLYVNTVAVRQPISMIGGVSELSGTSSG
jgi:hypothetical protein